MRAMVIGIASVAAMQGCVSVTTRPRALLMDREGSIRVETLACADAHTALAESRAPRAALDPGAIRILSWNIHKESDRGWQRDLRRFGDEHDLVLLQETVLDPSLTRVIEEDRLRFAMASSFLRRDIDVGVLTAARVLPLATCTERSLEPWLRIPKSAVIDWFALDGQRETLAVVNVHAINFSLALSGYRAQFQAIGDAVAGHRGPIVVAGDFNTWSAARSKVVYDFAKRLGLVEVPFAPDLRSRFFGHRLDHIYTRGLDLVDSATPIVTSSDHVPLAATLRVAR